MRPIRPGAGHWRREANYIGDEEEVITESKGKFDERVSDDMKIEVQVSYIRASYMYHIG